MNRPMIKFAAVAMLAACYATSGDAYAANPPRGKFGTQTAARKQENDDMKRKLAPYLTDEGMSGRVVWKEYTTNPKAKGAAKVRASAQNKSLMGRHYLHANEVGAASVEVAILLAAEPLDY